MGIFRKKWVIFVIALAIFGLVRLPVESRLRADLIEARLLHQPPARDAMSAMSQSVLMGTLGGMRSLVALYLTLKAFDHFSYTEWDELHNTYKLVTALEPTVPKHWELWIYHIGINGVADYQLQQEKLSAGEAYAALDRKIDILLERAVEVGDKACEQHPDSARIRRQLAEVYREKIKDYGKTADLYREAIGLPDSLGFEKRFAEYFDAQTPGREGRAYKKLMELYQDESNHTPSLFKWIRHCENVLKIPIAELIPNYEPEDVIWWQITLPGGIKIPRNP